MLGSGCMRPQNDCVYLLCAVLNFPSSVLTHASFSFPCHGMLAGSFYCICIPGLCFKSASGTLSFIECLLVIISGFLFVFSFFLSFLGVFISVLLIFLSVFLGITVVGGLFHCSNVMLSFKLYFHCMFCNNVVRAPYLPVPWWWAPWLVNRHSRLLLLVGYFLRCFHQHLFDLCYL